MTCFSERVPTARMMGCQAKGPWRRRAASKRAFSRKDQWLPWAAMGRGDGGEEGQGGWVVDGAEAEARGKTKAEAEAEAKAEAKAEAEAEMVEVGPGVKSGGRVA